MNLDRWNLLARVMRAPPDVPGNGAAAGDTAAPGAAAAPAADAAPVAPAADAAPVAPVSPLATADAGKRDGAPAAAKESAPAADGKGAPETPAKAGEAPPPGGTEGKDPAKPEGEAGDKKPDAAAGEKKPGETDKAKPEGADAAADKKPDVQAEAPPAPPPAYDAYKLPETLKLDETRLAEFNTILGEAELAGGAKHEAMQALGQKVMDLYAGEVQRIGEQVQKYQVDVWNRHLESELNVLKSDPTLGGNRIDTTLGNAKYVLEQFGGSKEEQDRFMAVLDRAGVSSNRDFVALLNRMFERYREPEPVPPNLPSVKGKTPGQRNWYDTVDVGAKA